jgi:Gas vesicle synthesis protein GvpL/GvpF
MSVKVVEGAENGMHDGVRTDPDAPGSSSVEPVRVRSDGLYLYALTRSRSFRTPTINGVSRIRYRDLDALVKSVPFELPLLGEAGLQDHQQVVEVAMRKSTVFPLPFGVIFRDRRELIRWIEDQYLALDEALSFLDGHWELRVHMTARGRVEITEDLRDFAGHVYAEMRRVAHAAMPLHAVEDRIFSAAFLVQRGSWVEFVERAEDIAATDSRLAIDVTGPWPAYDFARIAR